MSSDTFLTIFYGWKYEIAGMIRERTNRTIIAFATVDCFIIGRPP